MAVTVRDGMSHDVEAALSVWATADAARREAPSPRGDASKRAYFAKPDSFFLVAEDGSSVVGIAVGMHGLADHGRGPPIPGLCHIAAVSVSPERWGEGIGRQLVEALLDRAKSHGYDQVQLWTQMHNVRARRLYERLGFWASGREKDHRGERIVHYLRDLD